MIHPNPGGTPITIDPQSAEEQAQQLIDSINADFEVLGDEVAQIDTKADSANAQSGEIAAAVAELQRLAVLKDAAGRAKVTDPVVEDDIATKGYVDNLVASLVARIEALENPTA